MTPIEERAKSWAEKFDEEWKGSAFISYVKAANEQRSIDIEKAVEWIMRTPMYAKQPTTLIEDFRYFMNEQTENYWNNKQQDFNNSIK